jgi:hypothetical protein
LDEEILTPEILVSKVGVESSKQHSQVTLKMEENNLSSFASKKVIGLAARPTTSQT